MDSLSITKPETAIEFTKIALIVFILVEVRLFLL